MLRGILRGAAWCCVVCCVVLRGVLRWCAAYPHVVLRGPTWCYIMLRGDCMLGWWMMDVETWREMGMGGTCGVTREREGHTRCQFLLCLFTWESPFGGVCIHMQYIIHGLYFLCINIKKDRSLFPWWQQRRGAGAKSMHAKEAHVCPSPTSPLLFILFSSHRKGGKHCLDPNKT